MRDGKILTPPQTAGHPRRDQPPLDHDQSPRDLGYEVVERDLARAELYLADEVFLSGTAAELVPVREIDDHAIGDGEPRARSPSELQRVFDDALHGRDAALRGVARLRRGPARREAGRRAGRGDRARS